MQHRPAAALEQRAEALGELRERADAEDEHLRGTFGEAARELLLGVAEMQLGAHLQAVRGLRLRARIEQLAHALAGAHPACGSGNTPT